MKKISFMAEIDSSRAAKQLDRLKQKITRTTEQLNTATEKRSGIEAQMEAAGQKADETRAKVKQLKAELATANERVESSKISGTPTLDTYKAMEGRDRIQAQLTTQEAILKGQIKDVDALGRQWDKADASVQRITGTLNEQQAAAGRIEQQMGSTFDPQKLKQAGQSIKSHLAGGFKTVLKYALGIRSLYILARIARSAITEGLKEMTQYDSGVNKTVSNLKNALTGLKASLAAAFAPLLQAIEPVLTRIINLITTVINYIGMLFAALNGAKSYKRAIATQTDYAKSIKATGAAAKQAAGYLSGLDEIQRYDDGSSGGGGGGAAAGLMEGLEEVEIPQKMQKVMQWIRDHLGLIKNAAIGVGLAIAGWKISSLFTGSLKTILGIALTIGGAFLTAAAYVDMWKNGITDSNLTQYLIGVAALAAGLALVFTPVVAGIALVVAGVALAVVAIVKHWDEIKAATAKIWGSIVDWISNAWKTIKTTVQNALLFVLYKICEIYVKVYDKIVEIWNKILAFLVNLWTTVKQKAVELFTAVKNKIIEIFTAIRTKIIEIWTAIKTALQTLWENIKNTAINTWTALKNSVVSIVDGLKMRVTSTIDALRNALSNAWNTIRSTATSVWEGIKNAILHPIETAKSRISGIVDGIRSMFSGLRIQLPHIKTPHIRIEWEPTGWLGQKFGISSIPHLAIDWYARGGIINQPTWLGGNAVGGEAGKEAVIPLERHTEWLDMVAGRLADLLVDRLGEIFLRTPMPAVATGTLIPPRLTVELTGIDDLRSDIQSLREALLKQRGGDYRFTAQLNRRTLFDETIAEAKLRQSASGKNPFDL